MRLVLTAAALALALPATASAAANGTAQIVAGADSLPGPSRTVSLTVTNTESGFLGRSINRIRVLLPYATAGARNAAGPTEPATWVSERSSAGDLQAVMFTGLLNPGQSVTFRIPVEMERPLDADRRGDWRVYLSSDLGFTFARAPAPASNPGALTQTVRALEIVSGPSISAPAKATDSTATEGQKVDVVHSVRNWATQPLAVTGQLDAATETPPSTSSAATIEPDATVQFTHRITLGPVGGGASRTATLRASAASGTAAVARQTSRTIEVQAKPRLSSHSVSPSRVVSRTRVAFEVTSAKLGTADLTVDQATLTFGQNTATLSGPAQTEQGRDGKTVRMQFDAITIFGADGTYPARLVMRGEDSNGHGWADDVAGAFNIEIDSTAPRVTSELTMAPVAGGFERDATRSGDALTVDVVVDEPGGVAAGAVEALLRPDTGADIPVPLSLVSTSGDSQRFRGTASPSFSPGTSSVYAIARAADALGNLGEGATAPVVVDDVAPVLATPGFKASPTEIRVEFEDNRTTKLRGGCTPSSYSVTGANVIEVRFAGASGQCRAGDMPPDGSGVRVLLLDRPLQRSQLPSVSYQRPQMDPQDAVTDGAGNRITGTHTVTTRQEWYAPDLLNATRSDAGVREGAYRDTGGPRGTLPRWHTNRADAAGATPDLELSFDGPPPGSTVQVTDGGGAVLAEKAIANCASSECSGSIRVPVGSTEGTRARALRFVTGDGDVGLPAHFEVVLDTTAPRISLARTDGPDGVLVGLSEVIAYGTDVAAAWFPWAQAPAGRRDYYQAERVDKVDDRTRRVTVTWDGGAVFGGIDYMLAPTLIGEGRTRYEDRAGNVLADTL